MQIKNWKKFQHFKDRRPPWIKLYRDLLDDPDFHALSGDSAKVLMMLWLVASETGGYLPDIKKLSFRLRISEKHLNAALSELSGWLYHDDIKPISERYHGDTPETERETEKETETPLTPLAGGSPPLAIEKNNGPTPEDLMALWNQRAHPNLPRVAMLTETRKRHARARLTEHPEQQFWDSLINRINFSPLLRGERGDWKASFDWILNPQNMAKILEGNYSEKRALNGTH